MTKVTRLKANGLELEVREEAGAEPCFVLLHGLSSSRHIWDLVAPELAPQRVVAYDQRGHGQSDKPHKGYGFADMSADLASILDSLDLARPLLVGHSWGASVALEFAAHQPQRPLGLVMVDGGFFQMRSRPGMTWERAQEILRPPDIDGTPREVFLEQAQRFMPVWNEQVEAMLMSMFKVREDGTVARRFPISQHMQVVRAMWEQDNLELFRRVSCPTLLVPAYQDAQGRTAEWMEAKRQGVQQALGLLAKGRLQEMNDTVHDAPVQRPRELAAILKQFAGSINRR